MLSESKKILCQPCSTHFHPCKTIAHLGTLWMLVVWVTIASVTRAQTPQYGILGQIGGSCNAVAATETHVFVGEGPNLVILGPAHTGSPAYLGRVLLDNLVQDIAVSGNRAYVALQESGIAIIDISNPAAPKKLGAYATPAQAWNVAVSGNTLAVACENRTQGLNNSGLLLLNVSNPAAPSLAKYLNTFNAYDVDITGNYALCVSGPYLNIVDIAIPASASVKKTITLPSFGNGRALRAVDQKLYVCVDNASPAIGLLIYDITDPLNPVQQGNNAAAYQPYDVALLGTTALVANLNGGLVAINVSNAASPTLSSSLSLPGQATKVAGSSVFAYVAHGHGGFSAVDLVSGPHPPSPAHTRAIATEPNGARIVGTTAYVADATQGLQFFNLANRSMPVFLGAHALNHYGAAEDVEVVNGIAFVGGSYGALEVVDVKNPEVSIRLSNYPAPSWVSQVAAYGDYLFLACQSEGTVVLNKSNLTSLTQVASIAAPKVASETAYAYSVRLSGYTAYVGYGNAGGGLQILNFNPNDKSLTETGRYTVTKPVYDVRLSTTRIYLSCWSNGLEILSRVASGTPPYQGSYRTPGYTFQTALDGLYALMADADSVQIIDATKPSAIVPKPAIKLPGAIQHITALGYHTFLVSSREAGLYIIGQPLATGAAGWEAYH